MKKLLAIISFLCIAVETFAAQAILQQSKAVYVRVGPVYYEPTGSALVADTTSAVASWTCRLTKGIGTSSLSSATISLTASGGSNDCTHDGEGLWKCELTATDTNTVGGLEIAISYAGRLPCINYYDVVAADGFYDHYTGLKSYVDQVEGYTDSVEGTLATISGYVDSVEGSLATISGYVDQVEGYTDSVEGTLATISGYVDSVEGSLATISGYVDQVEGYTDSVEGTLATLGSKIDAIDDYVDTEISTIISKINAGVSLSSEDRRRIAVSGDIIPASGMTIPKFEIQRTGQPGARNLIARGLSYSSATPTVLFRLVDGSGNEITHALDSAFTHAVYAMHKSDVTGATPYAHIFKWTLSDLPDGWYQVYTAVEKDSSMVATTNTLILDPTPSIETSGIASQTSIDAFVADTAESFRELRSGHPADFQIYRTADTLVRAQAGVSSATSRYASQGAIYGAHVRFFDPFTDEYRDENWLYDYDETYGLDGRSKVYNTVTSVTESAVIDDVTLTTAGSLD